MNDLKSTLEEIDRVSSSTREKGDLFEKLILHYFRSDPKYTELYDKVELWNEYSRRMQLGPDTGIDIVASVKNSNEKHAIQCKNYFPNGPVDKSKLDSFFAESSKEPYTLRYVVTASNNWTEHAEKLLEKQQIPAQRIDLALLEKSKLNWQKTYESDEPALHSNLKLRDHQETALTKAINGFKKHDRGKMIMACGTGKTITSLAIAQQQAGKGGRVLYLVPSLSLLSQTLTEWNNNAEIRLHTHAVCSDPQVGKRKQEDGIIFRLTDLGYPATTNSASLARNVERNFSKERMTVVFSTYQSIKAIESAMKEHGLKEFDLIICDEAHRTTGASLSDQDESYFVRVHKDQYIKAKKRLYMTATPKIYSDKVKKEADEKRADVYSMDNEEIYGPPLYVLGFGEAVKRKLLVDYKVIILAVDEKTITSRLEGLFNQGNVTVSDAGKIIGCWRAITKQDTRLEDDPIPMRRAVSFCQVIEENDKGKISSKHIAQYFNDVVKAYQESERLHDDSNTQEILSHECVVKHVDGGMYDGERKEKLEWLASEPRDNACHILSNVRCLSEGVDVPALDAILFMAPRKSQVEVVQSVGRVMRMTPDKKKTRGYIILPVVTPSQKTPEQALDDNITYKVVWQVLQALRSHDDNFDHLINRVNLIGDDLNKIEIIPISDRLPTKTAKATTEVRYDQLKTSPQHIGKDSNHSILKVEEKSEIFNFTEVERAIKAKMVDKCGTKDYFEQWARNISTMTQTYINRITAILNNQQNSKAIKLFNSFAKKIKSDLNENIADEEIIEMLSQHLITKPIFDSLFSSYSFSKSNPVSISLNKIIKELATFNLDTESKQLNDFYQNIKDRVKGIENNDKAREKLIVTLYNTFFTGAFKKTSERLGIVYTPIEIVDFIIHSIEDILKKEFKTSLASKNVHIIDPFVGTGTFITRLLKSNLISPQNLTYKYQHEIHANEIILLAYYIATINIETAYHERLESFSQHYQPFPGICLADTFDLDEDKDLVESMNESNSERRLKQKQLDIRVIMANPPYSIGQRSANDQNQNLRYSNLDKRITETYVGKSSAQLTRGAYDSYIRAIRWATDRVKDSGVIGFVTNAGFLDAKSSDGLRKCLAKEFSSIYVFNLRGDARTSGTLRKEEGGGIFGGGSRTPIAISILVKNPNNADAGKIYYHDIGDYLSREEKLQKIDEYISISGITSWRAISPDKFGDWFNQRRDDFSSFIKTASKKPNGNELFNIFSMGIVTNRDAWCYNFSKDKLCKNISSMIDVYSQQVNAYEKDPSSFKFINEAGKISWSRGLRQKLKSKRKIKFNRNNCQMTLYRPFTKQWLYYDKDLNEVQSQMPKVFPDAGAKNLVICVEGTGGNNPFSALMCNCLVDLHLMNAGTQCFPLKEFTPIIDKEKNNNVKEMKYKENSLCNDLNTYQGPSGSYTISNAISSSGLAHFANYYKDNSISHEDIFYYCYGLFYSPDYRKHYANNLIKELPTVPRVKSLADFKVISKVGRALGKLHTGYESANPYSSVDIVYSKKNIMKEDYAVNKPMKFLTIRDKANNNKSVKDKSAVKYNDSITIKNIPSKAYEFTIGDKSALEWVMVRQCVSTENKSGITNSANDYATEVKGDAKYPFNLFLKIITVSLRTLELTSKIPPLDLENN